MKHCQHCQTELNDDTQFCQNCGTRQEAVITPAPWAANTAADTAPAAPETGFANQTTNEATPGAAWNTVPPKKSSTGKLIGIIAACLTIVAAGALVFWMLMGGSPAKNVEKNIKQAFTLSFSDPKNPLNKAFSGMTSDETNKLLGSEVWSALEKSPSKITMNADVPMADFFYEASIQSDPATAELLVDMLGGTSMLELEASIYHKDGKLYVHAPEAINEVVTLTGLGGELPDVLTKALLLDLNTIATDWNDSVFGMFYQLTPDDIAMIEDLLNSFDTLTADSAAMESDLEAKLQAMLLKLSESFTYEEKKDQELPSGKSSLDCVTITVPQEALITFMEDYMDLYTEVMNEYMSAMNDLLGEYSGLLDESAGIIGSADGSSSITVFSYTQDMDAIFNEALTEMRKADIATLINVYYDKDGTRSLSLDMDITAQGENARILAYWETDNAKASDENWTIGFKAYEGGNLAGELVLIGGCTFSEANGYRHTLTASVTESGTATEAFALELTWNPAKTKNNLNLTITADGEDLNLTGHYYVQDSAIHMGISEVAGIAMDVEIIIEAISGVQAPGYVSGAQNVMEITEEDLMEIMSMFMVF